MSDDNKVYELAYLVSPFVVEEAIPAQVEQVRGLLEGAGGAIRSEARPAMRSLSYPVGKFEQAWFSHIKFTLAPEKIEELKSAFKKIQNIIRFSLMHAGPDMVPSRPRPVRTYRPAEKKPVEKLSPEAGEKIDREIEEMISTQI